MNQLFPTVILKGRFPYKWAFAFLFFFPLSNALHGQAYKEMMNDPSINFYDVVDAAEQYFETHPKGKGSGWKGYQRWKNENEYKYYPSGDRSNVDPYFAAHQYQNFIEQSDVAQRSANNGWLDLGPYSIDSITRHYAAGLGRVEDLYVDPNNDQRIYLGSRSGGFWRSLDGGQSWEGSTTDFLPASGVNAITAVPGNPDSVLINVRNAQNGTSHGVYQSLDGGLSWSPTPFNPSNLGQGGLGTNFAINQIKYHPFVPERVLVSANNGLYRSEDNLATWTKVLGGSISEIEFHPTNPDIMYVYDYSNGGNKNVVLRSLDGGLNFTPSNTLDGNNNNTSVKMSVSPVCADCIYFASGNGIWKSENNGLDFTFISNPSSGSQGFVVNDQDTTRMLYGYLDAYASQDGGNSFEQVTWWSFGSVSFTSGKYIHADLRVAYSINGVYYVGTDGLICKSSDNGYTWEILTDDNGIRENYNLGLSQSNHFRTICGSQDNGTSIRHRGVWLEFYGADGMEGLIHPLNDDWMLGSWQYGGRLRTKNGGQTVQTVTPPGQDGNWIAPLVYDPNDHMRIYSFGTIVHRSDAFGTGWTDLGDPGFGDNIAFATIAENNSDILVVARGSAIKKSVDGGMTFTDIKSNLPNYSITDVVCDPNDDNTILVTYGRHQNDGSKVFVTHNGGTSWQNITYNLGNMPIRSIVVDHTDASNIYLGAEIGVYTMPMEGDTWVQFGSDMPNVAVREMEIMYGSNTLRAATWGRGLWEHPLVDRADYPKILYTDISSEVDTDSPKYGDSQQVTAVVSYTDTPTELFVRYSVNTLDFDQVVTMSNIQDSTWQSDGPLANAQAGSKVYFKVYAVGANSDTTESYKFMYEVRPFVPCAAIGSSGTGSDYIDFVSLNGVSQNSGQDYYGDFTDVVFNLNRGETYTIQIDLNYHWNPDTTAAWIDFNRDAVFSENERIVMNELNADHESFGTFTVPLDAVLGDTLFLRARSQYWGSSPNPCGDLTGEVEDYSVVVSCQPTSASFALTACDEYTSPSSDVYTSSQVITEVLENVAGCDSTLTIDLTVVHSDAVSVDATACDSYVLPQGDVVTESGTYITTLQNASGCDSVVTVQLTILNSSTESIAVTACDSYVSPSGDAYTSSQVITEVFQNAAGCDSTLVIDLTIGYSDSIFMDVTACDSYVLPQGDVVTESGLYVADFQTAQGCDSIVSVQLTILTSTSEAFEVEACGSYTSPDGTVYTSSQIIEETISNAAGCDSTLTIDLTIYTVDTEVTQAGAVLTAQASGPDYVYQWLDCGNGFEPIPGAVAQSFTATEDGNYAVLLSTNGCVDTSSCFPVVVTGIIESNFEQQVRVYPNPTSGHLVVDLGAAYDRISWKITDEQGRLIQSQTDDSGTQVRLHIDGAAGVYFITLESGRNRLALRVVKE
ncbi:MAG: GEVED domain-containing protein [Saprospiraceae bacterium]